MANINADTQRVCQVRDLSDLLKDPFRPLTEDERDHFDDYMSFKNGDKPAKDISITNAVNRAKADLDRYMGVPRG